MDAPMVSNEAMGYILEHYADHAQKKEECDN